MVIDDMYLYVCKLQFTDKVVVAHTGIMEETKATYPFKHIKVRTYNGNKSNMEVTIENPYESKIPTHFILGMVDADSYIGNWRKIHSTLSIMIFQVQLSTLMMRA